MLKFIPKTWYDQSGIFSNNRGKIGRLGPKPGFPQRLFQRDWTILLHTNREFSRRVLSMRDQAGTRGCGLSRDHGRPRTVHVASCSLAYGYGTGSRKRMRSISGMRTTRRIAIGTCVLPLRALNGRACGYTTKEGSPNPSKALIPRIKTRQRRRGFGLEKHIRPLYALV